MSDLTASPGRPAAAPARRAAFGASLTPGMAAAMGGEDGRLALPVKLFLLTLIIPVAFHLGPIFLTGMRLLLLVLIVPLGIMLLSGRFGRLHLVDFVFFLHVVWMLVALMVNNPAQALMNAGSTGAEFYGGYLVGRAFIRNRAQFITLCKWLAIIVVILVPLAILESQTGRPLVMDLIKSLPGLDSEGNVNNPRRMGLERAQTVFAHPIHFGLFCATVFALTFVALQDVLSRQARIVLSLLIAFACFLSLSSGALLAIILQAGLIGWYYLFRRNDNKWWILVGFMVFCYVVVDLLSTRTPIRVFMSYATFSAHNAYWRGIIFDWGVMNIIGNAANNIPPAPIFGIGLNDWVRPRFMHSGSMDNFWLVIGLRFGLVGLGLLAVGYLSVLWQVMRRDFTGDETLQNLRRAWVFIFMGLTFTLATVHVWNALYSYVFFLFGAGVWFLTTDPKGSGENADPQETEVGPHRTGYSRFPVRERPAVGAVAAPQAARQVPRQVQGPREGPPKTAAAANRQEAQPLRRTVAQT